MWSALIITAKRKKAKNSKWLLLKPSPLFMLPELPPWDGPAAALHVKGHLINRCWRGHLIMPLPLPTSYLHRVLHIFQAALQLSCQLPGVGVSNMV